jgi:DNA-binding GntR family transcriptional regulator
MASTPPKRRVSKTKTEKPKVGPDSRSETLAGFGDEKQLSSQTDAALDLIRSRIVDMSLEPGSRIDERLLVDRFKLGRTPAREAINRLVAEGFVNIVPQRGGTFVRKLDLEEMGEVIVAQQLAESILAQMCNLDDPSLLPDLMSIQRRYTEYVKKRDFLAITQLNQDFHLRIYRTIGNALFYDFAESTHRHVRRLNVYIYEKEAADPEYQSKEFAINLDEHNRIIEVIERQDRDALIELLPHHAKGTHLRLLRLIERKSVGPLRKNLTNLGSPFA